jgi:hypothetical protein
MGRDTTAAAPLPGTASAADCLAREVRALEAQFVSGVGADLAAIEGLLARARGARDDAAEGRVLCLLSRALVVEGRHEEAVRVADEAAGAFGKLDAGAAQRFAGVHAETFRAAGTALSKLGRIAEALPRLEEGARLAQAAIDAAPTPEMPFPTVITPGCALIRTSETFLDEVLLARWTLA